MRRFWALAPILGALALALSVPLVACTARPAGSYFYQSYHVGPSNF
ncbi:MAG: hypothetical protein JO209_03900 [Acidisphaera sp.]|nr:hypothetical protein [Acidisphaera sp.]